MGKTPLETQLAYRCEHIDRTIAALVRHYLTRAGLSVPEKMRVMLIDASVTGNSVTEEGVHKSVAA